MLELLTSKHTIHRIINLRTAAIIVQMSLVLPVTQFLSYELKLIEICTVIGVEAMFNIGCVLVYRQTAHASQKTLLFQHLADLLFLTALLYFSGGATNAFVSLLLIPIALAAVTLKTSLMILVTFAAISAYSILLYLMPAHSMHHMNMQQHFVGMWVNFLFSAGVVSLVVGQMAREVHKRELAIAQFREEQLKQEKVISIGVASAQVTHQLATPIATVQLLADELSEYYPNNEAIVEMQKQLTRCRDNIRVFRQFAIDTKDQRLKPESCHHLFAELLEHLAINFPDIKVKSSDGTEDKHIIMSDASFLPAVLNLVQNGIRASKQNGSDKIEVNSEIKNNCWCLSIQDFGKGFTKAKLTELGAKPINSEQGLGLAVFLTHASLERLGGRIELTNAKHGGALVNVSMPLDSGV